MMSTNEMAQVMNYLSAISREVGEFRQEFNSFRNEMNGFRNEMYAFRDRTETRLANIEREQRHTRRFMDRISALLVLSRSDADELRERVETLEGKKA